ncbi:ribonuclease domain-containing protein [Nocardioides nitrophenolicus]|uniref:ribonuclease domain-containing protein n=1 Tax=Nocardioides nitrophenolicus TaxID=60489 RepID=UPI00195C37CB|nr:ribonuclease domain-containing protein [Nocardioides nitrophenolicus]MBM7515349.1 ribonuclease T1 [Nocardioides nitrophenolicus]
MSRRTTQVVSSIVTVVLLVGVWWLQARGGDDAGPSRASQSPSVASTPSATTSARPSATPTRSASRDEDGVAYVDLADLPPEAAETVALIDAGGPFPYPGKDGSTFGNFEGVLPDRPRGYYAEYTVDTPGLSHRGARRIIAGDGGELYWTEDHYESFERIRR